MKPKKMLVVIIASVITGVTVVIVLRLLGYTGNTPGIAGGAAAGVAAGVAAGTVNSRSSRRKDDASD